MPLLLSGLSNFSKLLLIGMLSLFTSQMATSQDRLWRSELYPFEWTPGYEDDGRFLHDFSFAGYHRGERSIPNIQENILNVTLPPFDADPTGTEDATAAIQAAIDSIAKLGKGVVFLPEGTYLLKPEGPNALLISHDSTVLRGAGSDKTFLLNTETSMRSKTVIAFSPGSSSWYTPNGGQIALTADAREQDTLIRLTDVSAFAKGDRIILTTDFTNEFIAEHQMTGKWNTSMNGVAFCRTIKSIDVGENALILDIPVRYYLKTRDNARAYKIRTQLVECGIEDLSIGNVQSELSGFGENDYNSSGTAAYEVHASHLIDIRYAENCWVRRVNTFKPGSNTADIHLLSNGLQLYQSRLVTVDSCIFQKPQYEGGGGNGYHFILRGNDCLISHSQAIHARHNYDFKSPYSNGNVIYKCLSKDSKYATDFHMHLSMTNLFDNHTVDNDFLEAVYRPYGTTEHGHTTTQSVFWNTTGEKYHGNSNRIISSGQWGYGYVIGTQGNATGVTLPTDNNTLPKDHLEGEATGDLLRPVSLYRDQLNRRLFGLSAVDSTAWDAPEISLITPTDDATISGHEVLIEVAITRRANKVAKVVFLVNNEVVGEIDDAPYTFTWSGEEAGCYSISAYAVGTSGFNSNVETVEIIVGKGCEESFYGFGFEVPGKIEAEFFNKGKNGLSYLDTDEINQGGDYRINEPVDIEKCSDTGSGFNLGWIADGEFVRYVIEVTEPGSYDIQLRTASESSGAIDFEFIHQQVNGSVAIPSTGGWQVWKTVTAEVVELQAGTDTLQLSFTGSFNLNYFEVTKAEEVLTNAPEPKGAFIYPNPAGDYLYIRPGSSPVLEYTIYSLLGQVLFTAETTNNQMQPVRVDLSKVKKGTYLLKIRQIDGERSELILKNNNDPYYE